MERKSSRHGINKFSFNTDAVLNNIKEWQALN